MKNTARLALTGMALSLACLGTGAQSVYRCGSTYSQAPCTGGQVIDTSETLQTQQKGKGPTAAERDAKAAAALEKERLSQDARAAPAYIAHPSAPAAQPRKGIAKPRKLEQFTAIAPARPGDEKKKPKKKKKPAAKT